MKEMQTQTDISIICDEIKGKQEGFTTKASSHNEVMRSKL